MNLSICIMLLFTVMYKLRYSFMTCSYKKYARNVKRITRVILLLVGINPLSHRISNKDLTVFAALNYRESERERETDHSWPALGDDPEKREIGSEDGDRSGTGPLSSQRTSCLVPLFVVHG